MACRRCPLWATRTRAVPGTGPADARIMLVGEAPGRQEDLRGEPFVGAAGRVLDALLRSVGLTRGEVFITNVVKSRPFEGPPPGRNRAPRGPEIAACRIWLDEQLRIVDPAVVVPMGRIAVERFLPGVSISAVHGRPQESGGRIILPLYHPAAALRGRRMREVIERDFRVLRRFVAGSGRVGSNPPRTA
ncbi:MAG: uracil-DNA glycosylase [Armatimonadota bacterium]|nr:uracil-DNA glycosylase [Armatimonadota bacterium]MDR7529113.1 uracil-DNA glycosylase [Armatimonadota bacterium]